MDRYPLRVEARRDEFLSRWLWLVKWLLLIPHYLALLVLWTGLVVLTLVAYLALLFTGRYPAAIRAYNLGVLRWTWRVGFYGYWALGTDRYPPFTLADVPDYPARLHLESGAPGPRWLPLVAWLFAVPHLMLLGALNSTMSSAAQDTWRYAPISVVTAVLLVGAIGLLFTGRYPGGLHDLLIGVARWGLRVAAYLTLLTPRYPPFRLDQGGSEPDPAPDGPLTADPSARSRPTTLGSVVALVIGVLTLAPAVGLTVGGSVLLAVDSARDSTGYVSTPVQRLDTTTAAVTAEHLTITGTGTWTRQTTDLAGLRVTASTPSGKPLFVGVAPQSAVDTWLTGTAHDELIGVDDGLPLYDRATGSPRPASPPATQTFWLAQAEGPGTVTLEWTATDGEYAVVVANTDGTPAVSADIRGAVQVPDLTGLGGGLLTAGILLGLAAVAMIITGGVGLGRRHDEPPPVAPPTGPDPHLVITGS
ncbi:DUF4389 domain-containing protein [Actinoplanes xinjiangensis]|uniref:Uncharacterized protein DUF4389 n=1 Tax=Actinoplanes xinjiangensis TaxID=512350 RepID=A0A316EBL8_9ACTN|nr:DUF4389 domain-containing protein [Actinoplanes xinjiangensis]PWK26973.1 uncharacterized protein DUF4389 [Actinoplanes xinjiangensis]GIF45333.1 hypothetical protein Axi01nite_96440 [Actinoplanes xinjiangensis]